MALNLLVLVSIIYCTSAYVTVNVYEEDAIILKECTPATCNQLCRRMGFPGGDCINNRCECQKLVDKLETDSSSLRSCNFRECEQLCRRLGFRGGACVGDRCKCDNFRASESIADTENNNDLTFDAGDMDVNQLRSCNLRACEQLCRRLGFRGGACVGDRCKCDNFRASESIADTENNNDLTFDAGDMDVNQLRSCNLRACEQLCRRLGFRGGACVGDKCKCDNFRTSKGLDSAKINTEYRSCNYRECDRRCRRLKFPGGACVNNQCKCYNFRQLLSNEESLATNTTDNPLENDVKCDSTQCKTSCSERGLRNGICIEKECYCDMEDAETSSLPCEPHACNVSCQIKKRIGGFCLLGKCNCY